MVGREGGRAGDGRHNVADRWENPTSQTLQKMESEDDEMSCDPWRQAVAREERMNVEERCEAIE